jgi:hypothetical protein
MGRPPPRRAQGTGTAAAPAATAPPQLLAAITSGQAAAALRPAAAAVGRQLRGGAAVREGTPAPLDFDSEVRARLAQRRDRAASAGGLILAAEADVVARLRSAAHGWRTLPPAQIREVGGSTTALRARLEAAGLDHATIDDEVWCGSGAAAAQLAACAALVQSVGRLEAATHALRGLEAAAAGGPNVADTPTDGAAEPGRLLRAVETAADAATEAMLASRRGLSAVVGCVEGGAARARAQQAAGRPAPSRARTALPPPPPPPPTATTARRRSWQERQPQSSALACTDKRVHAAVTVHASTHRDSATELVSAAAVEAASAALGAVELALARGLALYDR